VVRVEEFAAGSRLASELSDARAELHVRVGIALQAVHDVGQIFGVVADVEQMNWVLGCRAMTRLRASRRSAFDGKSRPWNDQSGWLASSS